MAKAAASLDALEYLAHADKHKPRPVCVVFGDEPFLKRQVLAQLRQQVLGAGDGQFSYRSFIGEEIEDPRAVFDELSTRALFGDGERLVVVNEADPFVSASRQVLEDYVAKPKAAGVLALEVKTWASNTKLYKAVAASGLPINCGTPKDVEILKWMRGWAESAHRIQFGPAAAERLFEIVGPQMGRLEQEMAKLALLATQKAPSPRGSSVQAASPGAITIELVNENVGGWQVRQIWDMVQAAVQGQATEALLMLDRLVAAGEQPIGLLAMLASKLRPLAAATRTFEEAEAAGRRLSLRQAVAESNAKVWPQMLDEAERNMKRLGRQRTGHLYRWLLDADLALKGIKSKGDGPRMVLEELIVRLG